MERLETPANSSLQKSRRQVLGDVSQFEKAGLVAKLKAARDRKKAEMGEMFRAKDVQRARP